jgi:hypothetical protein
LKFRGSHLAVPVYLLLALIFTWPLVAHFGRSFSTVYGPVDALLQTFILGWDYHALRYDLPGIFNPPIFHPEPRVLTYMDHLIGETLVVFPVIAATGNLVVAYNVLVILSFVMSAWGVYRLVRLLGLSRLAAFLAGFLFTFSPYRFSNLGLLNQIQTQFIPLGLFFALRFLRKRRFKDLSGTAGTFLAQAWFGWYYTFHLALALALLAIYETARGMISWRRLPWKRIVLVSGVLLLLILPGLVPYLEQQWAMPSFKRSLGTTALHSADLLDYAKVNVENRLGQLAPGFLSSQGYWPGLVAVVFAVVAIVGLARRSRAASRRADEVTADAAIRGAAAPEAAAPTRSQWISLRVARALGTKFRRWAVGMGVWGYFILLGAMAFLLSLGPVLQVAGRRFLVPLPYGVAYFVIPGFASMRAPGRFAGLVVLAAAVLAGLGFHFLARRLGSPGRIRILFAASMAAAAVGAWSVPVPLTVFPRQETMPEAYRWIARQPGDFAILELPAPLSEPEEGLIDAIRQVYTLYHGKTRLDGVSGFLPPRYRIFRQLIQGFPRPGPLRAARRLGAHYILFHYGDLDPERAETLRQEAARAPGLEVVAEFGPDVIYELSDTVGVVE